MGHGSAWRGVYIAGLEGGLYPELMALFFGQMCMAAPETLFGLLELLEEGLSTVEHGRCHDVGRTAVMLL
jgi:hypothetical protein